jgi:hypothetical protein
LASLRSEHTKYWGLRTLEGPRPIPESLWSPIARSQGSAPTCGERCFPRVSGMIHHPPSTSVPRCSGPCELSRFQRGRLRLPPCLTATLTATQRDYRRLSKSAQARNLGRTGAYATHQDTTRRLAENPVCATTREPLHLGRGSRVGSCSAFRPSAHHVPTWADRAPDANSDANPPKANQSWGE